MKNKSWDRNNQEREKKRSRKPNDIFIAEEGEKF